MVPAWLAGLSGISEGKSGVFRLPASFPCRDQEDVGLWVGLESLLKPEAGDAAGDLG